MWVGGGNDGRKENIRETILTTSGIRCIDVPMVVLECVVITVLLKKKLQNKLGYREQTSKEHVFPRGLDLGTWRPITISNAIDSQPPEITHRPEGR
jgi:hypothetical protein